MEEIFLSLKDSTDELGNTVKTLQPTTKEKATHVNKCRCKECLPCKIEVIK